MISAKLEYNTKSIKTEGKVFCAYCGKEIHPDREIDEGYYDYDYYHCDCEDALKEIEIQKQIESKKKDIRAIEAEINRLIHSMPQVHYMLKPTITKL